MKQLLAIVAALIVLVGYVPYIRDIIKKKTRPNLVSWATWSLLLGIGAAALFSAHQPRAALLLVADGGCAFAIVLFGLRHGNAKLSLFDGLCQAAAIVGLILWLVFNSPLVAIVATITIDLIASLPTIRHAWLHPEEETSLTFTLGVVASAFTLISLAQYNFSGWIFPAYLLVSNAAILLVVVNSRRQKEIAQH